ncbi:MAG: hypothetical protein WC455_19165 [Dehalococcoidia bacterium]|jgi:hypothetical protein
MNNLTNSTPNRQMSLLEARFSNIRRIEHEGIEYFSLVDIMAEFSNTKAARQYWNDTKKRLQKDGFQLSEKILQLKLKAQDGKLYATDCTDGETMFRIVQSIPSDKAEPVRQWLASLGYGAYQEVRNPALAVIRRETELRRAEDSGYGQHPAVKLFRQRNQNIDTFKSLMTAVNRVCENPHYGHFVNAEYLALFGEIASDLKAILKTESIRNALPMVQLTTLTAAESRLEAVVEHYDHMSMAELLDVVDKIIRPMGKDLRNFCDMLGVHHITGERLITSGE